MEHSGDPTASGVRSDARTDADEREGRGLRSDPDGRLLDADTRVGVGSGNPVKRAAVAQLVDCHVEARAVDSGVSEQPTGHRETREGAKTRARRVLDVCDVDLGVGIEGGVARFTDDDGLYLVMWAAVTDGERTGFGSGPSLALPARIADRVDAGEELGPVMDDVLGTDDVAKKQGAAGAFTAGRLSRTDALSDAVVAALAPFVCDLY